MCVMRRLLRKYLAAPNIRSMLRTEALAPQAFEAHKPLNSRPQTLNPILKKAYKPRICFGGWSPV